MRTTPILRDFPHQFESTRLLIRAPRPGDGEALNAAVRDSFAELHIWMPWAKEVPTVEQSEEHCRNASAKFLRREDLQLLLFLKDSQTLVGSSGLHRINWDVPKFEIGYWCRTPFSGKGYIREASESIARFAFEQLGAHRVEIRADSKNERSLRIPRALGFQHEGTLQNDARDGAGALRSTEVFALVELGRLRRSGA